MTPAESAAVAAPKSPPTGVRRPTVVHGDSASVRRVLVNAFALVVAYALPRVLTLGAVVLAARTLGAARFGAYGAAGAAAVILSIVSTAGMQPLLVRELARAPHAAARLLRSAHWIKTGLNVLMLGSLLVVASSVFGLQGEALQAALLLGFGYAIGSYAENLAAYFQAVERMHVWTAANAAYGIVTGITGALLIWLTASLPWFAAAMILGQIASVAWLYRAYRRDHRGVSVGDDSITLDTRALLRAAVPFAFSFLALTIFCKADVLILSRMRAAAEVGAYTAAYKLVDIAQALALAAIIASYPRLARAAARRGAGERWAGTRLAEISLLFAAPAAALAFVWRNEIIGMLYGPGYELATGPAAYLAIALVPLTLNLLAGYILAAAHRMHIMALLYIAGAGVKLIGVALVAPRWGAPGVAMVMLGAELLLCVSFQLALHRVAAASVGARAVAGVIAVACACAGVTMLSVGAPVFRGLLLLALIAAAYAWLDVLPAAERAMLRAALRRRAPVAP